MKNIHVMYVASSSKIAAFLVAISLDNDKNTDTGNSLTWYRHDISLDFLKC